MIPQQDRCFSLLVSVTIRAMQICACVVIAMPRIFHENSKMGKTSQICVLVRRRITKDHCRCLLLYLSAKIIAKYRLYCISFVLLLRYYYYFFLFIYFLPSFLPPFFLPFSYFYISCNLFVLINLHRDRTTRLRTIRYSHAHYTMQISI